MRRIKQIFFFLLPLSAAAASAQQVVDVGKQDVKLSPNMFYVVGGSPVSTTKYIRIVSGSPYFNDDWMYGKAELADGSKYQNIKLKLDLIDNSLLFLNADSNEMIATASIKSITLTDNLSGKEYNFIFSSFIKTTEKIETGWYQALAEGQATMYKRITKKINEVRPYGSATIEQNINTSNKYFLFTNSVFSAVKKFKDIPNILSDKKDDLSKYAVSMKLTGKTDEDYADLITYYNQIVTK
ncbi:MAG TPA: hypothetical protein VI461_10435 [Chitinophagaceae bacterium]|nr:hypothetical protein [Chitinophagaceae bacterium]